MKRTSRTHHDKTLARPDVDATRKAGLPIDQGADATGADATEPQDNDIQAVALALTRQGAGHAKSVAIAAGHIKVDAAYRIGNAVYAAGWCTSDHVLSLRCASRDVTTRRYDVARHDVASHFNLPRAQGVGFVLFAATVPDEHVCIAWQDDSDHAPTESADLKLATSDYFSGADFSLFAPVLGLPALQLEPYSAAWRRTVGRMPLGNSESKTAKGHLEAAAISPVDGECIATGWVLNGPSTQVWIEDDSARIHPLQSAFRRFRQDVFEAFGDIIPGASFDSGFIALVPNTANTRRLSLKALSEEGVHTFGEVDCVKLASDPINAARWLFGVATALPELHKRFPLVDEQILLPLIRQRQSKWDELPVQRRQLGTAPAAPRVSVIVPLYGRQDFVEHQLIEFAIDPWFMKNAELIYVVDDPAMVDGFYGLAERLYSLYKVPFQWVWGSVNRGFSGANNLGLKHATAPSVIFLNSDAFPQQAGWARELVNVLERHPDIGVVGPRLVFADGSIQHASMEFKRRDDLGIWINHHPRMGLDPALDPHKSMVDVQAVTGACMAVRRADIDAVGHWDTGYLIGDFEDSDMCMKLRDAGLRVVYLPTVQMSHLERQSMRLLGHDEFRTRLVIFNASRHQTRWGRYIHELAAGGGERANGSATAGACA
jgi:GT2 family glycosyltransferase